LRAGVQGEEVGVVLFWGRGWGMGLGEETKPIDGAKCHFGLFPKK